MNNVREFIKQIPFLCGVEDPERYSEMMLLVYDHEVKNQGSVFGRKDYDKKDERSRLNVIFTGLRGDMAKIHYCQDLLYLTMLAGYREKWPTDEFDNTIHSMTLALSEVEPNYPEISEVYSVEASTRGWWVD